MQCVDSNRYEFRRQIRVSRQRGEVIQAVNEVHGQALTVEEKPRRPGDPPELVAEISKIHQTLSWQPKYDDLHKIVRTSLAWERKLLDG